MATSSSDRRIIRLGVLEVDLAAGELRKNGTRIKLQDQPFRILTILLERPGEVVTREELREKLWPADTFVEFEHSLNTSINKLRRALGDSAEQPRYVETIPRRGYRFVGDVASDSRAPAAAVSRRRIGWPGLIAAGMVMAIASILATIWLTREQQPGSQAKLSRLTTDTGLTYQPTISPDGKLVAFASDRAQGNDLDIYMQQIDGDKAIRITTDPSDDYQPHFSPDGTRIVFRSERDGGGIYTVPALGGKPRRISSEGRRPRFSPDGSWIAYSLVDEQSPYGDLLVVPSSGGAPKHLGSGGWPVWCPDSKHLIALHNEESAPYEAWDWWVFSFKNEEVTRTGARAILSKQGLSPIPSYSVIRPDHWHSGSNAVLFAATDGDSTDLWELAIETEGFRAQGPARRLTHGPTLEANAAIASGGRLVFSGLQQQSSIWSLPVNADQVEVRGSPERLTHASANDVQPSISSDGKKVVFISDRSHKRDVWLKDLDAGEATRITDSTAEIKTAEIRPDGRAVAYTAQSQDGTRAIFTVLVDFENPREICDDCPTLADWSPDGKWLATHRRAVLYLVDVDSGGSQEIVRGEWGKLAPFDPRFSPDGQWLTFHLRILGPLKTGHREVFVVPLTEDLPVPREDWIAITGDSVLNAEPDWSPDGEVLYYLSNRSGVRGIWAQRLDSNTKRPTGEPVLMYEPRSSRLSLDNIPSVGNVNLSVAQRRIVFAMGELTGNVWMIEAIEEAE